ncbi:MAG: dihydrofolate reductase [Candidatus Pacebacteria bacterium]|nr:dihydrofolate reductase [Candidatus Paceibacterota bacterium]MCF7856860.1 dihydrofolate reductase [Candidatus Paceibacterota bacterium]
MKIPRISIIAAVGRNRELGKKNELIWRISDDLKRVKALTMGHPIIMGLNTYKSIGRPLPGRTNIVLSSAPIKIDGCIVVTSLDAALEKAHEIEHDEIFIFGGARVYDSTISLADRLYLTVIDAEDGEADAYFPDYSMFTQVLKEENHPEHEPPYTWVILGR